MKKIKLTLIGLAFSTVLSAQGDSIREITKMNPAEVNLLFGWYSHPQQYGTIAEFQTLAPGSTLLKANFAGYNQSSDAWSNVNGQFAVNVGFRFANKNKTAYRPNPILRLGFTYLNTTDLSNYLVKSETFAADTLKSLNTGTMYYLDSVNNRSFTMRHNSDQIRLDLSLVFRTNPKARWQLYGGIGLTAGVSLNANTTIQYAVSNTIEDPNQQDASPYPFLNSFYEDDPYTYQNEYYRNKADLAMSFYSPLGIDFRMGKKRPFWKQVHLFYEFRPGFGFTNISEIGLFGNTSLQQGFGIKVNWE